MTNHFLDGCPCRLEILTGVKVRRMLCEILADGSGHGKTEVAVDINLADCHACGLAEHILGHADSVGHITAVGVDHLNKLGDNGACTVEHDGEAGQTLFNFFENVKAELGLGAGLELVCAVAGTDRDSEAVNSGALDKFLNLSGIGIACVLRGYLYVILNAFEPAKFALDDYAVVMSVLNDLTGKSDVFFK